MMKRLGILGGMGPMAGAYFYTRVIANTAAEDDRGHIPVILLGETGIPDRTESILQGDGRAKTALLHGIDFLERSGSDMIAIPCNTAHAFLDELRSHSAVPILDMPRLAVGYAAACGHRHIGVLSTRGCCAAGVYERAASELGCTAIALPPMQMLAVEGLIYRQKAGQCIPHEEYHPYIDRLYEMGADCVLLACTEISLSFDRAAIPGVIDSLEILARATVALFFGRGSEVETHALFRTAST